MFNLKNLSRDRLGAILLAIVGVGAITQGASYRVGSLNQMGAGFFAVAIGALMVSVALAIAITATPDRSPVDSSQGSKLLTHGHSAKRLDWRGCACIVGGVASFVVLGAHGGLVPASFTAVFVSAMGDREANWKSSAILAAVITVFGAAVFHYALHLQLPLFQWGG